ncbi:MAG: Crp/Fnr family transcriptional regulator [Candidatus Kapabacteria bacterium]|nr:Crp/Fnr family transcriptional regulator [Candidatus Kapabacteria bacterium]
MSANDALIRAYERFGELTEDMKAGFIAAHTPARISKGERWLRAGDRSDSVAFVVSGCLHMFYEVDGRVVSTQFVFENGITSDYGAFLRRSPATMNIEALEDCELLMMSYDAMQNLYQKIPGSDRIGRRVAEYLFMAVSERNDSMMLLSPEQRYEQVLETRPKVMQRVPLYLIASYLGVTPEALSRIRRRLSERSSETS